MFLSRNVQYRRYIYSRLNYELVSRVQIKERLLNVRNKGACSLSSRIGQCNYGDIAPKGCLILISINCISLSRIVKQDIGAICLDI